MTLTVEECQAAAERADQYPAGYGLSYIAVPFDRNIRRPINPNDVAGWFKRHPEDIPKG
jgi:hypothetical protein